MFVLLVDLASNGYLGFSTKLIMLIGTGAKYWEIDIQQIVNVVGISKAQGLLGLHNFSGADWGGVSSLEFRKRHGRRLFFPCPMMMLLSNVLRNLVPLICQILKKLTQHCPMKLRNWKTLCAWHIHLKDQRHYQI